MRAAAVAVVLTLAMCSAHGRVVSEAVLDADPVENDVVQQEPGSGPADDVLGRSTPWASSWLSIARCAVASSPLDCVEVRSQVAVDAMLAHMSEARAAQDETALEPEVVDKVSELSEVMVEAAAKVIGRRLGLSQDDEEADKQLVEEGRGKKKKKKIHKLIALVKLVLLVLVVKLKLAFLMMALQTLFQFKIMVLVFLILITKKICLWAQLKQHKLGSEPEPQKVIVQHHGGHHGRSLNAALAGQQVRQSRLQHVAGMGMFQILVIYYEHAQHQHHYDEHGGGWGGGHEEHAEPSHGSGGWGGLWGRSYETATAAGVQSGVYRAADGTRIVVRQPDAHDLAYGAQRP
ncbi:hypothetical protein KUF71_011234 [Frankliniella fusca]|uniref:Uncharacterized protein n=1 Tax=Frankliniella fusca TaxID=407009 RepID=A0AAE1HJ17_9NEOP|nr:hypothetical protein KUF71_011234 [Frankliniella fusca]